MFSTHFCRLIFHRFCCNHLPFLPKGQKIAQKELQGRHLDPCFFHNFYNYPLHY